MGGGGTLDCLTLNNSTLRSPPCLPPQVCPGIDGMLGAEGLRSSSRVSELGGNCAPFTVVGRAFSKHKLTQPQVPPLFSKQNGTSRSHQPRNSSLLLSRGESSLSTPLNRTQCCPGRRGGSLNVRTTWMKGLLRGQGHPMSLSNKHTTVFCRPPHAPHFHLCSSRCT